MTKSQNVIRYWMPHDQTNPRKISFATYKQALEMLAFYREAGFRCEFLMPGLA
jgi:D-alanyl-lipoteichoic acid acyltransferase DltB (MBOAT superfamily)